MRLLQVTSPEDVLRIIRENFSSLGGETVEIKHAGQRVVGSDVIAPEDVPGFDRSTVDGYALRACDSFGAGEAMPALLNLGGEVRMGEAAPHLPLGACIYVPTGGMIPEGADAVVMLEDTEVLGDIVNCYRQVAPGENIIRRGEDISRGEVILKKGRLLRAPEIGVLASLGITDLQVTVKPRVGILSTGDEIVPYTTASLPPGQVRDSNALAVGELARQKGAEIIYGGILQDSYEIFKSGVEELLEQVDFLVLSGGSSVGTRDFTAQVLEELGKPGLLVEGVAIQPGKPTLLAKCREKPVLGLPGHPVSALNIFALFGTAIIDRLLGREEQEFLATVKARLSKNIPSRTGRTDFVRVKLSKKDNVTEATPVFGRSGLLRTLADAQGLVIVPAQSEGVLAGSEVDVILWE
ncbi:MAG: gephyrin-like molybdotransferase Glp [Bacillota bacterium]|uniref:Molybdopterin molybdenumtransferase n=1 Tax=Thermanaerosceptrum fracticalcis TaxID=1712410 RepID=A0A7G6E2B7_THEFR|nr:gephyrin-like molybdotransferase Glp [Thermanaerosceptrum fracticalcis]QNB46221.1 molybdopterin molybdenumtransferase MoeA [Thermanaerosceptrum fracticalcis]